MAASIVYVFRCEGTDGTDKYWVGRKYTATYTEAELFANCSTNTWCREHDPIQLIEVVEASEVTSTTEKEKLFEYMEKFGSRNVRGATITQMKLADHQVKEIEAHFTDESKYRCHLCDEHGHYSRNCEKYAFTALVKLCSWAKENIIHHNLSKDSWMMAKFVHVCLAGVVKLEVDEFEVAHYSYQEQRLTEEQFRYVLLDSIIPAIWAQMRERYDHLFDTSYHHTTPTTKEKYTRAMNHSDHNCLNDLLFEIRKMANFNDMLTDWKTLVYGAKMKAEQLKSTGVDETFAALADRLAKLSDPGLSVARPPTPLPSGVTVETVDEYSYEDEESDGIIYT